jgi:hypothetical protein
MGDHDSGGVHVKGSSTSLAPTWQATIMQMRIATQPDLM